MNNAYPQTVIRESDIAVISMSCRFPGAQNVDEFWQNLRNGVETVSFFSDKELLASGVEPALLNNPAYVKARGILPEIEAFDAGFFGFSPREVEIMDPQQRLFLEEAWKTIERAGYDPRSYPGAIGVYAGASMNTYLLRNLYPTLNQAQAATLYQILIGNNPDFLSTRISYKLNLKGPSVTLQSACSTSLVAIHFACQSLLNGECEMALAGGVCVHVPQKVGYVYQEGMIMSPDGHCRAFDSRAQGIVMGNGVGVVLLKRLEDALHDGDTIYAVVKGTAVNNDGALKAGYTAPGVEGQANVIMVAQVLAEVDPATITYIEAHGTGTPLGDPIEIAALTRAFRRTTAHAQFCAIGSVKTNFGHLDAAAGVAGFIKTVLALQHRQIPPSLHFEQPNPSIDFAASPFYVNSALADWRPSGVPCRAGVSAFGIGGTNAHVVLEEFDTRLRPPNAARQAAAQVIVLSANSGPALDSATDQLATYLEQHPEFDLADAAYTLQVGRQRFPHRRAVVCATRREAIDALANRTPQRTFSGVHNMIDRPVVFMFPGQGAQYVNMGRGLYQTEPVFQEQVDRCAAILQPLLQLDVRDILYPPEEHMDAAEQQLIQTALTQPALFVIEYALAQLWLAWGVRPAAVIGHSLGEYSAACLAGVLSMEDALTLVAMRGRLMQALPPGAMLSVPLTEPELQPLMPPALSLAAVNAPAQCVVSGPAEEIEQFQQLLAERSIHSIRLHTSHAFHSAMMEPIMSEFQAQVNALTFASPSILWVSTVTGDWMPPGEPIQPTYWIRNLRQTVQFAQGLQRCVETPENVLLEVGPGHTLSAFAKRQPTPPVTVSSLRHPKDQQADTTFLSTASGKLWLAGVTVDWQAMHAQETRRRVPLPTYPFERQRYWIEPDAGITGSADVQLPVEGKQPDLADWFYQPVWQQTAPPTLLTQSSSDELQDHCAWLLFIEQDSLGSQLARYLSAQGKQVITVVSGGAFAHLSETSYQLDPCVPEEYGTLWQELTTHAQLPRVIVHLWNVTDDAPSESVLNRLDTALDRGFYSLLYLSQAIANDTDQSPMTLVVVSNNMQDVIGDDLRFPEKATLLGPVKVIPQEMPYMTCRSIDLSTSECRDSRTMTAMLNWLCADAVLTGENSVIAYRGGRRWVQTFTPVRLTKPANSADVFRQGGVYLITGGLGGIGGVLAEYLARTVRAKLILTGRTSLPKREMWTHRLNTHSDDEAISRKIRMIRQLEALGAEVLAAGADVADAAQMHTLIQQAEARFGKINGVIHTAGVPGGGLLQYRTRAEIEPVLRPKIEGLLVLESLLNQHDLDWYLLCSSLTSVLGGIGQVDYCAANLFLDAFAHWDSVKTRKIGINWDAWRDVGMAAHATQTRSTQAWRSQSLEEEGLSSQEGIDIVQRVVTQPDLAQVIISTGHLESRIAQWRNMTTLLEQQTRKPDSPSSRTARPQLSTPYMAPRNRAEQRLADIWQDILGIEQVGIHDDFFELGGDSLMGVQLIGQIRQHFEQDLSIAALLQTPMIAQLALQLDQGASTETATPLIRLHPGGDGLPVICVHPADGNVFCYQELARQIGMSHPVYGLQAYGIEPATTPLTQIEEMATAYIASLRTVLTSEAYVLVGFSAGGPIAYAMAHQFRSQGVQIPLLMLIDSLAPHIYHTRVMDDEVENFLTFSFVFGGVFQAALLSCYLDMRHLEPTQGLDAVRRDLRGLTAEERLRVLWDCARQANIIGPDIEREYLDRVFHVYTGMLSALHSYSATAPTSYPGQMMVVCATDGIGRDTDDPITLGWEGYAAATAVHELQGDHFSLLSNPDSVHELVAHMKAWII